MLDTSLNLFVQVNSEPVEMLETSSILLQEVLSLGDLKRKSFRDRETLECGEKRLEIEVHDRLLINIAQHIPFDNGLLEMQLQTLSLILEFLLVLFRNRNLTTISFEECV